MKRLALLLWLLLLGACSTFASEIAVTFDDLPIVTSSDPIAVQQRVTRCCSAIGSEERDSGRSSNVTAISEASALHVTNSNSASRFISVLS